MKKYRNDESIIPTAQQNGLSVNVRTVNTKEDMRYFLDRGVDYITTDQPERLLQLMQSRTQPVQ
jgi:glycerophosphoryl diester phosphodiesterase